MSKKIHGLSKRNWKCFFVGFIIAWIIAGGCCAAFGGVPVKFTVETSRADVQEVQCYHGETLDFDVTFKNYGRDLVFDPSVEAQIFWQTNGMSAFYWRTNNVNVVSNRMTATFLPEMDPGANTVFGFIGIPGNIYRASFVLRLKQSPGVKVKEMEWPYRELDFAKVEMKNVPFYFKDESDEMLIDAVKGVSNNLYRILHREIEVATPGDYENVSNKAYTALQSYTERDPTVPAWAKRANPPDGMTGNAVVLTNGELKTKSGTTITATSVGAATSSHTHDKITDADGNEIAADGTVTAVADWTPSHTPTNSPPQHGDIYYGNVRWLGDGFDLWWVKRYLYNGTSWDHSGDEVMSGDYKNPDATELTFPNGITKTYRERTVKTKIATTNDLATAIAANKPEYEDIPSNVVWRIEAEGGRFFFKPVRPINMED